MTNYRVTKVNAKFFTEAPSEIALFASVSGYYNPMDLRLKAQKGDELVVESRLRFTESEDEKKLASKLEAREIKREVSPRIHIILVDAILTITHTRLQKRKHSPRLGNLGQGG